MSARPSALAEALRTVQGADVRSTVADYLALTKPRIILLLVVTCYAAMAVAARGWPDWRLALWTMLGLALSAGGANAVNMWYDRDVDRLMDRTRQRPLPAGRMRPEAALAFGIALALASVGVLVWAVHALAALLALAGFVYYVFVYTMWLKRRTPHNIVIGGGAGAFPPLVGWAAVRGAVELPAILMFLIVFLWTPPHFWALALFRKEEYRRAGIPMMPVVRGDRATKWQTFLYAVLLVVASLLLYGTGVVGKGYLAVALVLGLAFVGYAVRLLSESRPEAQWAQKTFHFSLLYLAVLFAAMVLDIRHP